MEIGGRQETADAGDPREVEAQTAAPLGRSRAAGARGGARGPASPEAHAFRRVGARSPGSASSPVPGP